MGDEAKVIGRMLANKAFRAQFNRNPQQVIDGNGYQIDQGKMAKLVDLNESVMGRVKKVALVSNDLSGFPAATSDSLR